MHLNAVVVSFGIVRRQGIMEECQDACREREADENSGSEGIGKSEVHGKSEARKDYTALTGLWQYNAR